MRKLMVGLIGVALAAVAAPAHAQGPGLSDPLGLIASGAVLPFFGADTGASQSWLEVSNPGVVGEAITLNDLHMFFFDKTCTKGPVSKGQRLTPNDIAILRVDNSDPANPQTGLMALAGTDNGFGLDPADAPFHARIFWLNSVDNHIRVLEPISAANEDVLESSVNSFIVNRYNPLNEGVAFFAPLEKGPFATTTNIILICPRRSVLGDTSAHGTKGLSTNNGFPLLHMPTQPNPLRGLIFDDNENLLRDFTTTCDCLTTVSLASLNAVYSDAGAAPNGTYTILEGVAIPPVPAQCDLGNTVTLTNPPNPNAGNACPVDQDPNTFVNGVPALQFVQTSPAVAGQGPFPFTGYRDIKVGTTQDIFGRLSNGSAGELFLEF
jgi:hypothetical protein